MTAQSCAPAAAFSSPADWKPHLALGITGHRSGNPAFDHNRAAISAGLADLFGEIAQIAAGLDGERERPRIYSLLVDGTDQIAAELALAQGWELVVPLPFGEPLNLAINAHPASLEDAAALCRGDPASDPAVEARAGAIRAITARARLFELAERDAEVEALWLASLCAPQDRARPARSRRWPRIMSRWPAGSSSSAPILSLRCGMARSPICRAAPGTQ